jgi:hypothetical protein
VITAIRSGGAGKSRFAGGSVLGAADSGGVVGNGRGRLATQLCEQCGDVGHDGGSGAPQHFPADRPAGIGGQVHRRPGQQLDQVAREQARVLAAVGKDHLGAPVGDRDHRGTGHQGEPGNAGLAHHRPQIRIPAGGALRVDNQAFAVPQPLLGLLEFLDHQRGAVLLTVHRQLAALEQERADHLDVEHR